MCQPTICEKGIKGRGQPHIVYISYVYALTTFLLEAGALLHHTARTRPATGLELRQSALEITIDIPMKMWSNMHKFGILFQAIRNSIHQKQSTVS